jgi:uncharacterized protein (TIGR03437 family)
MKDTLTYRFLRCGLFLTAALLLSPIAPAVGLEPEQGETPFTLTTIIGGGLSKPDFVTHAGDGSNRLFIVEQTGKILILPPGATAPLPTPFLDVSSKIACCDERGLLGLAFHPQYAANGRFFVDYTRVEDGAIVIAEFRATADPNVASPQESVVLIIPHPASNHNGGNIAFGPDGFLYIGTGDGGGANDPDNRAQNIEDLLGKFLRIDINTPNGAVLYSSPSTNPYVGVAGRDEIYAIGLRNPFRWSFDRATGELYAGDVGQDAMEEIDLINAGGNYGWRVWEATRCTGLGPGACTEAGYTLPIIEYGREGGRCSIIGGYVYRGSQGTLPPGTYLYGDFCSGEIFTWNKGIGRNTLNLAIDANLSIASFGEDEAGEIYVVDLNGSIHRLTALTPQTMTVSAAAYRSDAIATESIATVFGAGFASTTTQAPGPLLPTTLDGVSLRVHDALGDDRLAPLFYASPTQLNFQIPQGSAAGVASYTINTPTGVVGRGTINVSLVAPGFFSADASGTGLATAVVFRLRADGSQSYEPVVQFDPTQNRMVAVPIDLGPETDQVFLILYGSGFRYSNYFGGGVATIGGEPVDVSFAGPQGQFAGVDQANLRLSRTLSGKGEVEVQMNVGGRVSNAVRVAIR